MRPRAEFWHDSGFLVEAVQRPGVSGVIRLVSHDGLSARPAGAQTLFVSAPSALTLWCGFYAPTVCSKRWQPFDQPSAAAYMPLPYDAFERVDLEEAGVFLIQRLPRDEALRATAVDDGNDRRCEFISGRVETITRRLRTLLADVGVPDRFLDVCVQEVVNRYPRMAQSSGRL